MTLRRTFSVAVFARATLGPHRGRVLLIRHKRLQTWLPVGGEVEAGEDPLTAAARELHEETGLSGTPLPLPHAVDGAPPGLLGYEEHSAGSKGLHLNFCFVFDVDSDAIVGNGEFDDHRFYDAAGVRALAAAGACPKNVEQMALLAIAGGRPPLVEVARAWLDRFNHKDLDGLLALYATDAVHVSPKLRDRRPETRGEIAGHDALRAWWADAFERLPGLRYVERAVTAEGDRVFLEYLRTVPGEPDLVTAELYVVDARGLIVRSHVFHG